MRNLTFLSALCFFACASPAPAQTQTTDPVGFTTTTLLANSDTLISIPFVRSPEFNGSISAVSASVITVAGVPGWTVNQFVYVAGTQPETYFVLIEGGGSSNPKEGHIYQITANGTNTLTVDTSTDTLEGITVNTQLLIIPYWTPASIFPASNANVSFTPTTLTSSYQTQLLVPNNSANGINLPVTTYFFSNNVNGTTNNVGWRIVGDIFTDHGDDVLAPNSYFIVRNQNGAPTLSLKPLGGVLTKKLATGLRTSTTQQQDNAVAMVRPADVKLIQTGLNAADGSFVDSFSNSGRIAIADRLLLFDNSTAGFDKQPSAIYYHIGSGANISWRKVGDPFPVDRSKDVIPAGSAIVIRKATTTTGQTAFWTNTPTY